MVETILFLSPTLAPLYGPQPAMTTGRSTATPVGLHGKRIFNESLLKILYILNKCLCTFCSHMTEPHMRRLFNMLLECILL